MNTSPIFDYLFSTPFSSSHYPVTVIAGPCSAESEEQLNKTASALVKEGKTDIFRCGIWKPRTRPNGFEGMGEPALDWLQSIRNTYHLQTCVEVATPKHVEACLKKSVDILWIGARTTSNPFSVQALADALQGVDIPILIKNPLNPDIHLWIGALERIYSSGIKKIGMVHRGFAPYGKSSYRNDPCWEVPIELRRQFPDLVQICDPSHMGGKPQYLYPISQYALDLGMEGLMIEVHSDPEKARTDAFQQITPSELTKLLDKLTIHQSTTTHCPKVETLRMEIDRLDHHLLELLAQRMAIVETIGECKKKENTNIYQPSRWKEMLVERLAHAESLGLDKKFIQTLMEFIHEESIRMQNKIYH